MEGKKRSDKIACLFQEKTFWKIERSFADSKQLQGLRYCR
ncbi:transposase for [Bacillus subtilis subsp. subtilis str. RO-NN-1]|nr:transposase for [Bacillus subtilis subsp. subtilis str. RO-NN-1]